jgi:hypothetical protein
MRSIKPGRGPSILRGITAALCGIIGLAFLITTILASNELSNLTNKAFDGLNLGNYGFGFDFGDISSGFSIAGIVFSVAFIIMAIVLAVYNFKNATRQNRLSTIDITEPGEEPDPLNLKYGKIKTSSQPVMDNSQNSFCPYCGTRVNADFEFCRSCGRKLPQ